MSKVSGKAKRLCKKLKNSSTRETDIPSCDVCGGNGSQTQPWQPIDGLDTNYLYSLYRTVTKKVEEMSGVEYGKSCCSACKDKYTGQWRLKYLNVYVNKTDKTRHEELMNMSGIRFSIAQYNDIMSKTITKKTKAFAKIGIDYDAVNEAIELGYYNRYVNHIKYITFNEWKASPTVATEYATYITKLIFADNVKRINYMQHGDENVYVDFITKQPFFVTDFTQSGNDKFKDLLGELTTEEIPDYHHFLLKWGQSIMKVAEPAVMLKTNILTDQAKFIESMGLMSLGKTVHKKMHSLYKNFDIVEALDKGIAPWWAQSESNYKQLQAKYPGVIDEISFTEMLGKFTLENYNNGTYVVAKEERLTADIS